MPDKPLFDMSKATPIAPAGGAPLFDMSKATPIASAPAPIRPAGLPPGVVLHGFPAPPKPDFGRAGAVVEHPFTGGFDYDTRDVKSNGSETGGSKTRALVQNLLAPVARTVLSPIRHPVDTVTGAIRLAAQENPVGSAITHAMGGTTPGEEMGAGIVGDFKENGPAAAIPHLLGTAAGMYLGGEAAKPVIRLAAPAARVAGSGLKLLGASPDSLKLSASRILSPGTAGETLVKALKPGIKYGPEAGRMLASELPRITAQNPNIGSVSDFVDATGAAKQARAAEYASLLDPHAHVPVDTTPMVRPQMTSIPATDAFETPSILHDTWEKASPYDMTGRPEWEHPPLGTLDNIRQDTNAKLRSFYNREAGDQNAALSNPKTARIKAVNDGSRDLVYSRLAELNRLPESEIRGIQNSYGNLAEIENLAGKREVVFGRHDPVSLAEKVATGHGGPVSTAWNWALQKTLKGLTDSDALVRSGIDRAANPTATPLAAATGGRRPLFALGQGLQRISPPPTAASALFFAPSSGKN